MTESVVPLARVDERVGQLFALVSEALAGATDSLLSVEPERAERIIEGDKEIDDLTERVERSVWQQIEQGAFPPAELRELVAILLILPELERSADLAEHIAQRATRNIGAEMSPATRGIVQQMSEVALDMWQAAADAYADRKAAAFALNEADEEMDSLHARITNELAVSNMSASVTTEVALVARFYERLGDHAVNLARRVARLAAEA